MAGRTSSQCSDSSNAGTSKNTLLTHATKGNATTTTNTNDDLIRWKQTTDQFDFGRLNTDVFPTWPADDYSVHKNDEALLADFTALLADGDDPMPMSVHQSTTTVVTTTTTATTTIAHLPNAHDKSTNNITISSTDKSISPNGSIVLVETRTRPANEQHSQSIGSIMSDHDYLSRENTLEIMNNDEENFFSQGNSSVKVFNESMDVNFDDNLPSTLNTQESIDMCTERNSQLQPQKLSAGAAVDVCANTMASLHGDQHAVKSIIVDELAPLLHTLSSHELDEREQLIETFNELEKKMSKLKEKLVGEAPSTNGKANNDATNDEREKVASECGSDPLFPCDRSEPLEYYGMPKGDSASDDSDNDLVTKLKAQMNVAEATTNEARLVINTCRRDLTASTAQVIGIKFVDRLEKMSRQFLRIASEFKATQMQKLLTATGGEESLLKEIDPRKMNDKSRAQLMADFSSSSSSHSSTSSSESATGSVRHKRKKKSRGKRSDPNLSQINGIDDDDQMLMQNGLLLNGTAATKRVNVDEELNKWKDDGAFYGFGANDAEDCANSSIEIDVKSEPNSQSMAITTDDRLSEAPKRPSDEVRAENSTTTSSTSSEGKTKDINETAGGSVAMRNDNGSLSENDASDEGEADDDDNEDDADDEDKEIERLLDFSSLGVKRKSPATKNVPSKLPNGTAEPKIPSKKVKKGDGALDAILRESQLDSNDSDSDDSTKSKENEITEEQYLKQQNLNMKNQLLADTSNSESDDDIDIDLNGIISRPQTNGVRKKAVHSDSGSGSGDDEEDEAESDGSCESLVDQFLEKSAPVIVSPKKTTPSTAAARKVPTVSEIGDKNNDVSTNATPNSSPSKPPSTDGVPESVKSSTKPVQSNEKADEKDEDSESVSQSSVSTETPKRKSKSKIGANAFSGLTKDVASLSNTDESDTDDKSKKKNSSKSSSDCEILDTSLFKNRKKALDSKALSKMLKHTATTKSTASRVTPEDCISLSSDDELEVEPISNENAKDAGSDDDDETKKSRPARKLLRADQLAGETKRAQREESERIKRSTEWQSQLSQIIQTQRKSQQSQQSTNGDETEPTESDVVEEIILDHDKKKKENIVVHREIQKHLKSHQIDGIRFMYECCYGSVNSLKEHPGSGCILAHCMGLGKTLQLIALLHTVISYPQLKTNKVLVICPKSTVLNWKEEIERWLRPIRGGRKLKLLQFQDQSTIEQKLEILREWNKCGNESGRAGCLLLGYEAFRMLVFAHTQKKAKQRYNQTKLDKIENAVKEYLLNDGATDLVICDEGHMIKNQKSTTSLAVNQIDTSRRIILTGTPIQNNLKEYYSMVNFIKPSFLGTEKEFNNLYANPIKIGQHKDSSKQEIKVMKQRSYVLHKKLSKFVQRREAALLKTFLPDKYEYVIFVPMTDVQNRLYEYFLENNPLKDKLGGKSLISDYTILRKIWTHPKVLENAYLNALREEERKKDRQRRSNNDEDEEDRPDDFLDSHEGQMSVRNDWWRPHVTKEDLQTILPSNKLKVLFEILKVCKENGEKCLIFSAFVAVLDVVEFFMKAITKQTRDGTVCEGLENYRSIWSFGEDYYRLDGKTPRSQRHQMITNFNSPGNPRARVFLISAKAGGQGINLTGANRVILLDTSWNPSNDQQNIFRVFRLGQKKVCYIYRLLAMGSMEEKVYSRSVTKQAMSCRVVDEQQIDRHYNMAELTELYTLAKPDYSQRPTPTLPYDKLLAHLLHKHPNMIFKYHEHDSLLEQNNEQDLSEADKADAWAAYERDVEMRNAMTNMGPYNPSMINMSGGSYDNNYPAYNSLYSAAFGGTGYSANSSMMSPYLSQYSTEYQQQLMRMYAHDPYGQLTGYPSMYGTDATAAAAASLYNNPLLSSPPPPPTTPSSATSPAPSSLHGAYNSRSLLGTSATSSSSYNTAANNFLTSLMQTSSAASKNYAALQAMYMNSLAPSGSSGSRIAAPIASPLASTSKSSGSSASSFFDSTILSYMQQNNLFGGSGSLNATTSSTNALSSASGAGLLSSLSSNASSRQGPNAKRNPMLSKELSMLSSRAPYFDSLNLSTNQTSVITESPTNSSSTGPRSTSDSTAHKDPLRLTSPDSHLVVKNVNAINQTIARSTPPPPLPPPSTTSTATKNSVSITSIPKNPNVGTNSPGSNTSAPSRSANASNGSKSTGNGSVSSSTDVNTSTSSPSSITNALSSASALARTTNMGIVYPDKERLVETNKERNSPVPKPGNMGIVYPRRSDETAAKVTTRIIPTKSASNPIPSKSTAQSNVKSSTSMLTSMPHKKATLPNESFQRNPSPVAIKSPTFTPVLNATITSVPIYSPTMLNSSVTVTPVTVSAKSNVTVSAAPPSTVMSKSSTSVPRSINISQTAKTNLSSSITLSPISTTANDKDTANKAKSTTATWRPNNNSMTISKTTVNVPAIQNAQEMAGKPRAMATMSSKPKVIQQQRSSPVIVRHSPVLSANTKSTGTSPATVRRVIVGNGTSSPKTVPVAISRAATLTKVPASPSGNLMNNNSRKRPNSPTHSAYPKQLMGTNAVSITQMKRPKLSLESTNARPLPIVRTFGAARGPTTSPLKNIRVQPNNNNSKNNSQNSQRSVRDISTTDIVELD